MNRLMLGALLFIAGLTSCATDRSSRIAAATPPETSELRSQYPAIRSSAFTILISNDDGYNAPGLRALSSELNSLGRIVVAAPNLEQSGKGHSLLLRDPVFVDELKQPNGDVWYQIGGPPATCVRLAIESLLPEPPHVVVSGINRGDNLGATVYHSGTVGAAREAAIVGIPAIAVSIRGDDPRDYQAAAIFVRDLISQLRSDGKLKPGLFLNVNVPAGERKGVRLAELSTRPRFDTFERHVSPRGQLYFWPDWKQLEDDVEGTDVWAFVRGFITVTPMKLDVSNNEEMAALRAMELNNALQN